MALQNKWAKCLARSFLDIGSLVDSIAEDIKVFAPGTSTIFTMWTSGGAGVGGTSPVGAIDGFG